MEPPYVIEERVWISLLLGSRSCYLCLLCSKFVNVCSQEVRHTILNSTTTNPVFQNLAFGTELRFAHKEILYPQWWFKCRRLFC
jgi:hypothetical protein